MKNSYLSLSSYSIVRFRNPSSKFVLTMLFLVGFFESVFGQAQSSSFTTAGTSGWLCPAGVTSITVKCWGAGGGGGYGRSTNGAAGGGGGGGAYAQSTISVTPGTIYIIVVGAGGAGGTTGGTAAGSGGSSSFNTSSVVAAGGGNGTGVATNASGAGGAGGTTAASTGATKSAGGAGAAGVSGTAGTSGGGGGGAGASSSGTGASGSLRVGGTGVAPAGSGGSGASNTAGGAGGAYGAGGAGGHRNGSNRAGGAGASGAVIIEWTGAAYVSPSSVNMTTLGTTTSTTLTEDVFFYDNGGSAGDYDGNPGTTIHTFYPKSCSKIEVQWVSYALENCACDYLTIFDGNSVFATSLGSYGNSNPGTKTSTAADGSLTFQLVTDANTAAAGWYAILRNVPITSSPSQPSTITGTLDPEVGGTATYSVTNVSGVSYAWSVPSGWTIDSGQGTNSISVTVGSTNGVISCTPSKCGYTGTARTATTTIPEYRWKYVSSNLGSLTWTPSENRNLSITIKNTGVSTWNTGGSPTIVNNIGVRWNSTTGSLSGTPWNDYHSRTSVGTLAPGATNTFTLPIQAKNATAGPTYGANLADGTYYLAFDLVSEGCFWFSNNPGSNTCYSVSNTCSGNSVFYSDAQTVSSSPTISVSSLTAFSSVCITSTAVNSFTISGVNLTNNVSIAALTGYTYSTSPSGPFTSTLTITQSGGIVNETVYVKFTPVAVTTYSGNIVCSSTGATSKNVAASGTGFGPTGVSAGNDVTICSGQSTTLTGTPAVSTGIYTLTSSGGSYASEKWMNITTGINGTGTVVWAQGNGTIGNGSGYLTNQSINLSAYGGQTLYLNAYDQYDDSWDGSTYSFSLDGVVVKNNGGISPTDGADTDASSSWDASAAELETSEAFTVPQIISNITWSTGATTTSINVSPTTTTTYTFTATISGCSVSDQVVVNVNSLSTAPSSISGTNNICPSTSTTLTANAGTAGYEAEYVWYPTSCATDAFSQEWTTQPYGLSNTTQNSVSNGILNVTSTSNDPMIDMAGLGSFDPNTYRYVNIRYKVTSGTANNVEIFFYNTSHNYAVGGETGFGTLISDNTWRTVSVDMWTDAQYKTGGNIQGWRFDWATASGVTMDIDFITLSNQPILGSGSTLSVTPSSTTNYYVSYKGGCNTTACATTTVTVQPTLSYGTVSTSGQTTICYNTAPTGISTSGATGSGSFSYQWYSQSGLVTPTSGSTSGWNVVAGQTSQSLTLSAITGNTTYACWVTPGGTPSCGTANWAGASNSDKIQITVRPQFTSGTIASTGEAICSGGDPALIGSSVDASGGDNIITYKWQANGVDIASTNASTYNPPIGLTATTIYTRFAKDGICNAFTQSTGSWTVTIGAPTVTATVATNDFVWNGVSSTAWNTTSNWLQWNGTAYVVPASYPNASTANVILPAASGSCGTNAAKIGAYTISANNLTIELGHAFQLNNASAYLKVYGALTVAGTWSSPTAGSTLEFAGASQTIPAITVSNITTSGSGTKTVGASTLVVNNVLTIGSGTTFSLSNRTMRIVKTGSGSIVNNGTWDYSTGTVDFRVAGDQTIPALTYYNLTTTTSGNRTLSGTTTVNNILTIGASTNFQLGSNTLNLARLTSLPITNNGTIDVGTGTVAMTGSGTQLIPGLTYYNLTSSATGTKSLNGTTVVNNNLTLSTGTVAVASQSLTLNGPYIQGTVNNLTTTSSSSLVLNCTGTGPFTLPNQTTIGSLTINSPSQTYVTNSNLTISSGLTLTEGILDIGASKTLTLATNSISNTNGAIDASDATSTIEFANTTAFTTPSSLFTGDIGNLKINGTGGISLGGNTTVSTSLALTNSTLTVGANTLTLNGNTLTRTSGSIDASDASATLAFGNSSSLTLPASVFSAAVNNMTLNNARVLASSDFTINGILNLNHANPDATNGLLDLVQGYGGYANVHSNNSTDANNNLNSVVLTLGSSATVTGAGDVTGKIRRTSFSDGSTYAFGNPNMRLTFNQNGGTMPSQITVVATKGAEGLHVDKDDDTDNASNPLIGGKAVKRMHQILRTGGTNTVRFTVRFPYDDTELNGNTEANLVTWDHHLPYSGMTPHEHGKTSINTTDNYIELSNHGLFYIAEEGDAAFTKYWMLSNKVSTDTLWLGAAGGTTGTDWSTGINWSSGAVPSGITKVVVDPTIYNNQLSLIGTPEAGTMYIKSGGVVNGGSATLTLNGGPAINGGSGTWLNEGTFNAETSTVVINYTDATMAGTTEFNNLTINSGKLLTVQSDAVVKIKGTLTNSGTLDATSNVNTIEYTGSSQSIEQPNGTIPGFYNLTINQSSGDATLSEDARIKGALTMNAGNIITDATKMLEVGISKTNPGTVNWNAGTVVGPMKRWFSNATNSTGVAATDKASGIFPVGLSTLNRYAQVNFTEAPEGGYLIVQYHTGKPVDAYSNFPVANSETNYRYIQNADTTGYWELTPYSESGTEYGALNTLKYKLKLRINTPGSINQVGILNDPPSLRLVKAPGNDADSDGHGPWEAAGTFNALETIAAGTDYVIESKDVIGFSWFNGGGNNANPLPVVLLSFTGQCTEVGNQITWKTASEHNSAYYELQASRDGENWTVATTQNAAGNSNEELTYQYFDQSAKGVDVMYYRLRQVDIDNNEKMYDPILIGCGTTTDFIKTYPNPSGTSFNVLVSNKSLVGISVLKMIDTKGTVVTTKSVEVVDGINLFTIDENVSPGMYYISISNGTSTTEVLKHSIK